LPLPMWEVDASGLVPWFEAVRQEGVQDLGIYLDAEPESMDQAISLSSITRMNRAAKLIARAEGRSSEPGLLDPASISPMTRRVIREQLISHFQGDHHVDVEISLDDDNSGGRDLRLISWVRTGGDGELDLSSVVTVTIDLRPLSRLDRERGIALEQFELIFENAAAGIFLFDTEMTGVIMRANRAFTDMLG